jgi:hypothetical protein
MLATLPESAPAPDPTADKSDIAQTVRQSVMAEQVSHNVVNVPESASGSSPLVDVVANHTSTSAAESGNNHTTPNSNEAPDLTKPQLESSTEAKPSEDRKVDAGEAAAEPSAGDAAAKPDNVPAIATPPDTSEKGGLDQELPILNGLHDAASQGSAIEDGGSQDASAVNSDSEISKGEIKDGHLHVRANSVKKPATFSKISVTKNFLAKSASTAPTAVKTGERGKEHVDVSEGRTNNLAASPVTLAAAPVAKPRLIAKTGASVRELQKARQNAESPSGPDASTVWNKNRPTVPPPPKQFTDEELKQQYGIHLATRLQSDENGRESKWADIDEDEDDWVPEAVTWIDGTKSALTPADNVPAPKDVKPAEAAAAKPAESAKPVLAALKKEPSGPPKTILKPGAAAQAKQLGTNSQSPGPEKATLKAKSPAPPSKSPWAVLPPVDKASPIIIPAQNMTAPPPFASQDARAYDSSMPPPQPAREIAADTFDRSWQQGEGQRRELFNSVSGHYEPAPEGRRSSRPDPYGRKPSVLLRSSGTDHPEPSPAFQTRSGSQTDGPPSWAARRRGSSVSQSGAMAPRRMSVNRGSEPFAPHDRRPSVAISHDNRASPVVSLAEPPQNKFTHQDAWSQQMPAPPPVGTEEGPVEEMEDPVKVQERVMKEKRELARKRKQEQEDEKEAEKKERLKEKMARLAGAGESRQARLEREAAEKAAASALKATSNQTSESKKSADAIDDKATKPIDTEKATESAPAAEAPADAPQPRPTEATTSVVPAPDKIESPSSVSKPESADMPPRSMSEQMQRQAPRGPLSPKANTRTPFQQAVSSPYRAPNSAFSSPGERKQQPFGRSPMVGNNDGFSPWPSAGSGNVWGTAGIGNGVFESASAFAPMPMMAQQGSSLPPPPGMGRPDTANRISPQGLGSEPRSQSLQPSHGADQSRSFGPHGMEGRPDHFMSQARPNGASPGPSMGRQQRVPGPIAPPSRAQPSMQAQHGDDRRINAWKTAAQTLPAEYANAAKLPSSQHDAPPAPREDTFKETFKQTTKGRLGGPRKFEKAEYTIHDAEGSRSVTTLPSAPPNTQTQPAVPIPTASPLTHPWKQAAENTVRLPNGSMNPAHGGAHMQQLPIGHPQGRPHPAPVGTPRRVKIVAEPLPPNVNSREPPPETAAHPAYAGNAKHPHVRLPRSKPVVKLPPQSATATSPQPSVVMPPRQHWGPPGAMRPLVQNEAWQARFNGLFNRTITTTETPPSPPKTPPKMQGPASEVTSSTRTTIGDNSTLVGATVSLPQMQQVLRHTTYEGFNIDESKDVTSKDTIEAMFNEELSFGSKPMMRIPRNVSYPEASSKSKYNMLDMRSEDLPRQIFTQSIAQYDITQVHGRHNKGCYVSMPGLKTKHNPIFWKRSGPSKGITKSRAKAAVPKENVANPQVSTAPNGGSNAGSRKVSSQKVPTASTAMTPQYKSPAPVVSDNAAPVSKRGGFKAQRGRGQAPVKST